MKSVYTVFKWYFRSILHFLLGLNNKNNWGEEICLLGSYRCSGGEGFTHIIG